MESFSIRPVDREDRNWIAKFLDDHWGSTRIVSRGEVYLAHLLEGFIAMQGEERVGLITYRFGADDCEIVTFNSLIEGQGIGTALIDAVKEVAVAENCRRLWLITTNDNMQALRYYQKRGFRLLAVYPSALDESRKIKPEIPLFGKDGIPLRDEIELELPL